MTSRNTWDPTKYDSPAGESERLIKQFSSLPIDITNIFYNDQGDIRVTKGDAIVDSKFKVDPVVVDSEFDSKPDPVVIEIVDSKIKVDPVVLDSEFDSKHDLVTIESKADPVVESEVGPAVVGNNIQYKPKPNGKAYQSKPKKKQRRNQRQWNNNKKKIRLKYQPHVTSFPDHLLPTEGVPMMLQRR